jgi:hypothetical protein
MDDISVEPTPGQSRLVAGAHHEASKTLSRPLAGSWVGPIDIKTVMDNFSFLFAPPPPDYLERIEWGK